MHKSLWPTEYNLLSEGVDSMWVMNCLNRAEGLKLGSAGAPQEQVNPHLWVHEGPLRFFRFVSIYRKVKSAGTIKFFLWAPKRRRIWIGKKGRFSLGFAFLYCLTLLWVICIILSLKTFSKKKEEMTFPAFIAY